MKKIRFKVPHTLVVLFSMVMLAQLLTYVIPAGEFDRIENEKTGRMQVKEGSFHYTPDRPAVSPGAFLMAIPKGLSSAHEIVLFVLVIGGTFAVLRSTGAMEAGMGALLRRWGDQPFWLIAGGITIFAVGSATVGFGEEYYPFVPVLIGMTLALGFDRLTAIAIIMIGYGAGYAPAPINPFTTLVAQDIAGLEPYSGMSFRILCFCVFVSIGIHHVWAYARKVKRDPSASLVADIPVPAGLSIPTREDATAMTTQAGMSGKQKLIMAVVCLSMIFLIFGMIEWKWYLNEMQAVFVALTLIIGVIARISPNRIAAEFSIGAGSLTSVALLIGVARGIQVVLDEGGIVDTLVYGLSVPLEGLPATLSAVGMFFVQTIANFFIPSGSGQAYVTMPIMAPLADLVGVSRQVAVLAFQFGDGFSNIIIPTQYVLVGILAMAGIPYDRWVRFVWPFMVKMGIAGSIALIVAVWIGWGVDDIAAVDEAVPNQSVDVGTAVVLDGSASSDIDGALLTSAAQDLTVSVDGVWGIPEEGTDKEGASCDRWATGPGGKASAISDTNPSIQNKTKNDENQIRYGAQDVDDSPPPCLDFPEQSGFGFDGAEGVTMPTDGTPFKLGVFTQYNFSVNIDVDYNPLANVGLTLTLSGDVDALLKCHITLDETANDDVPCKYPDAPNDPPCGERVMIAAQPLLTPIIPIEGKRYIVEILGFTDCDAPGTPNKIFYTHEQGADKACLYARLVALPTGP